MITVEGLAWIEQMEADGEPYECPGCNTLSLARDALTSAILLRAAIPAVVMLALAHQACLPSRVYDINTMAVIPQGKITLYAWVDDAGESPHAHALLDLATPTVVPTAGGEQVDLILAGLLDDGMSLVTAWDYHPPCGRFAVEIGGGQIIVWRRHARSRSAWYAGPMDPRLGHWRHTAKAAGTIDLAVGSAIIPGPPGAQDDGDGIWPFVDLAINEGQLVGATVAVLGAVGSRRARS